MTNISRRSVARGAVWTAPAVAMVGAAPAMAASATVSSATACNLFEGTGGVNYQTFRIDFGFATNDGTPVKAGTTFLYTFTMDASANGTTPPGLPSSTSGPVSFNILSSNQSGATTTFTVQLTVNSDIASGTCTPNSLTWDESGTSSNFMVPNTNITMTQASGTATAGNGTVANNGSSLQFNVGQRYAVSNGSNMNKAFKFISHSGAQGTYPSVQYSAMSNYRANYGTNGSTCAAEAGNNSSTIYPDGSCAKVNITSGQASVPARA